MMMFDWMNHEDAEQLDCPYAKRRCRGCLCMAWIVHPDEGDERGMCARLMKGFGR